LRFGARALTALLVLPLLVIAAWILQRSRTVREDPAAVLGALRATHGPTLPAAQEVKAGSRSELESFDRETLYQYIDGAAEAYLTRGFQRCVVADYTFPSGSAPAVEATAEVYRFDRADGAAEQLAVEKPAGATPVVGIEGTVSDGDVLLSLRGRDLLKVTVLAPGPAAAAALERIAAAWWMVP
jgi:hypothetical protein